MKTCLPDVNFWLALTFERHAHHVPATRWIATASSPTCIFCRATQQGFLRLATNPRVFGDETLTMADAWRAYDQLFDDPRTAYADEPEDIERVWCSFTQGRVFSPKVWSDAYLAAFALACDFELVTFDRGLAQYKDLRCTVLT